jgi:hypothetical protein
VRSPLDALKESNARRKSDIVKTPLDFLRQQNAKWKSWRVETPLDLLRLLNLERRRETITRRPGVCTGDPVSRGCYLCGQGPWFRTPFQGSEARGGQL